jgi:hypothetical protein
MRRCRVSDIQLPDADRHAKQMFLRNACEYCRLQQPIQEPNEVAIPPGQGPQDIDGKSLRPDVSFDSRDQLFVHVVSVDMG